MAIIVLGDQTVVNYRRFEDSTLVLERNVDLTDSEGWSIGPWLREQKHKFEGAKVLISPFNCRMRHENGELHDINQATDRWQLNRLISTAIILGETIFEYGASELWYELPFPSSYMTAGLDPQDESHLIRLNLHIKAKLLKKYYNISNVRILNPFQLGFDCDSREKLANQLMQPKNRVFFYDFWQVNVLSAYTKCSQ